MKKTTFMPSYYVEPKPISGYLNPTNLEEGSYKIRILSHPIVGWEKWVDKKPQRFPFDQKPDEPGDGGREAYIFTAMIVWNYELKAIQVLHVKQASLRKALIKYADDPNWGAPFYYDLTINKEGEGKNTEYTVVPVPPSSLRTEIVDAFRAKPICLNSLFFGGDPFKPDENGEITPMATESAEKSEESNLSNLLECIPGNFSSEEVEAFVELAANHLKISPENYIDQILASDSDLANFVKMLGAWVLKNKKSKSA